MKIEELAVEVRGRQAAIETIMLTTFAHLAAHTESPVRFITQTMKNAEQILRETHRSAADDESAIASAALDAFEIFSRAMIEYVAQIAPTSGRA